MNQDSLDNALLGTDYDDWLDRLLEMEIATQELALEKLAQTEPDLARSLRAAVLDGFLGDNTIQTVFAGVEAKAGDQIGAWTLRDMIAQGGMGAVWRASRTDGEFEQLVAIKILPGALSTASTRQRFERERQMLAGLRHAGIAALYDGGLTKQNHLWFALEYIPGIPITDYCEELALSLDARLVLMTEVCDAVAHAHEHGVVHRDIKPQNILVEKQAAGPRVVLLDFGIAGQESSNSRLTMTGLIMGTPGYMSPEQARGETEVVDRRSDVFSLGIVLYELLSKRHPFEAGTPSETLYAILHDEPQSLTRSRLPTDLVAIILHCLEKEPNQRYPSVLAVGQDIQAYLKGDKISVKVPGTWRRWRRRIVRKPVVSAVVGLSLLASVSVIFLATLWSIEQSRKAAADIALVEEVSARSQVMRDQVRLAFMRPIHDVEPHLRTARLELDSLIALVTRAETRSAGSLKASLGISAQLLDLPGVAVELLNAAWNAGNRNDTVFAALYESYAVLYFEAVNRARLIGDADTSRLAIAKAEEQYLLPVQGLLGQSQKPDGPLLQAYSALLDERFDDAVKFSRLARKSLDWPWPAWQIESQVWSDREKLEEKLGNLELAKIYHGRAGDVLKEAAEFARSLPVVAARQCQLDANLVYLTELHVLDGGVFNAPGCERLNVLSPGDELHRSLVAIAYEKAAIRMLRFAKAPGQLLDKARALVGEGELTTVDGFYARGLLDGIEGEQRYLSGDDSTDQLLQSAKNYESALALEPGRTDIRAELSWTLTLAGVNSSVHHKESAPHFLRSQAVWQDLMRWGDPPLIAVELMVVNLVEWSLSDWANGQSREVDLRAMVQLVDATVAANPDNKSFFYTLGTLHSNLAAEAFWRGLDPEIDSEKSLAAFEVYFEEVSSFAAQDVLLATLINNAQYQHDRQLPYARAALLQQRGQAMLGDDAGLVEMSLVLVKASLLQMKAEEAAIAGKSPIADLVRARELFGMIPEGDNSWPRAITGYARALWHEYQWRFSHQSTDCRRLAKEVDTLAKRLSGGSSQPFPRSYLLQLLHEIPPQHECQQIPELGQQQVQEQWRILKTEHQIVAARHAETIRPGTRTGAAE